MEKSYRIWSLLLPIGLMVGCASAQLKKEREEANQSVQALRALQSVVSVGIDQKDYSKRLQDCKIVVDHTLQGSSEPKLAEVKASIAAAMESYQKANEVLLERPYDLDEIRGTGSLKNEDEIKNKLDESKDSVVTTELSTGSPLDVPDKLVLYPKHKVVPLIWTRAQKQTDLAAEKLAKL